MEIKQVDLGVTAVYYQLVTDMLGTRPNARLATEFKSVEEATKHWEENFRDRNEDDEYNEYWNNIPLMVMRTITVVDVIQFVTEKA